VTIEEKEIAETERQAMLDLFSEISKVLSDEDIKAWVKLNRWKFIYMSYFSIIKLFQTHLSTRKT